jgi:hypothetical protein
MASKMGSLSNGEMEDLMTALELLKKTFV